MLAYIRKWGKKLRLCIPLGLAKQLNLHPASVKTVAQPKYCLDILLSQITSENQHHLIFDEHIFMESSEASSRPKT